MKPRVQALIETHDVPKSLTRRVSHTMLTDDALGKSIQARQLIPRRTPPPVGDNSREAGDFGVPVVVGVKPGDG